MSNHLEAADALGYRLSKLMSGLPALVEKVQESFDGPSESADAAWGMVETIDVARGLLSDLREQLELAGQEART